MIHRSWTPSWALPRAWKAASLLLIAAAALAPSFAAGKTRGVVLTAQIKGVIDPPTASYVRRCITLAERKDAPIILRMDTPGGSLSATEDIVTEMLNASVPVIVYVAPVGAHAMSAGTFITLAAHVAAMAPGTNIGAATPVFLGDQPASQEMKRKAVSHGVSMIRAIAERRKRNVKWAEDAVRRASSSTASQALKDKVIDLIAENTADLLKELHGRRVEVRKGLTVTLNTKEARTEEVEMSTGERFLHALAHPEIAYILMTVGVIGIIAELYHPGVIFPGVTGVICLLLAFYSLSVLSVNFVGVALILLGLGLLVADLFVTSHGVLTVGGIIAFVVGSIMLTSGAAPGMRLAWHVIVAMTTIIGGFFLYIVTLGLRAQRLKVATGAEGLIGAVGEARSPLDPRGSVFVTGELWRARTEGETINENEEVIVTGVDGLTLKVKRRQEV